MCNSPKIIEAANKVFEELNDMPDAEFTDLINNRDIGVVGQVFIELGVKPFGGDTI